MRLDEVLVELRTGGRIARESFNRGYYLQMFVTNILTLETTIKLVDGNKKRYGWHSVFRWKHKDILADDWFIVRA